MILILHQNWKLYSREEIILWIKRVKIKVFSGKRMSNLKLNALKDEKMTPRGVTPVSVYSHLFSSFFFQLSDPSSILFQIPASSSQCCKNCYRTFLKKCTHQSLTILNLWPKTKRANSRLNALGNNSTFVIKLCRQLVNNYHIQNNTRACQGLVYKCERYEHGLRLPIWRDNHFVL